MEFDDSWTARDLPFYLAQAKRRPGPVLELACGTGRLAVPLARAGLQVVGLDACPIMLERARAKAPELRLVQAPMQDFELNQQFGLIFIALGSFYDLRTIEAQEQTLRCIHRHLHPEGRLLIDLFLPTPAYVGKPVTHAQEVDLSERVEVGTFSGGGKTYRVWEAAHHVPHEQTFTIHRLIESPGIEDRLFRICGRYVHRYEMQHLLRLCGFKEAEVYGNYDYAPFDAKSKRMIWVAGA